jgi:hypothetical protein
MNMNVDPRFIVQMVSEYFEVPTEKMFSISRVRERVFPRQVCQFLLRTNTTLSLVQITRLMQGDKPKPCDHSTVISGVSAIKDLMFSDENVKTQVTELQTLLYQHQRCKAAEVKRRMEERRESRKGENQRIEESIPMTRVITLSEYEKLLEKYA